MKARPKRDQGWAGTAKLSWDKVQRIRKLKRCTPDVLRDYCDAWGVTYHTLYKARVGGSWPYKRTNRLPEEYKKCMWCGAKYGRNYPNGRRREPLTWQRKRTCCASCNSYLIHHEVARGTFSPAPNRPSTRGK